MPVTDVPVHGNILRHSSRRQVVLVRFSATSSGSWHGFSVHPAFLNVRLPPLLCLLLVGTNTFI